MKALYPEHQARRRMVRRAVGALLAFAVSAGGAAAQVSLEGEWGQRQHEDEPERGPGPEAGEYQGLPLTDEARYRAESWSSSLWTVPERQCIPHPADYGPNFSSVRISKVVDPSTQTTVAFQTNISWMNPVRTIWMDGRAHPPAEAFHTWEGFSTGKWEGDVLVVDTTHLKPAYARRNGVARSEKATLREYFYRVDNVLTWVTVITDPANLTEPIYRSRNFQLEQSPQVGLYTCSTEIEVPRAEGEIPHYLPGTHPDIYDFAKRHNLPWEGVRGGAATMYPEYEKTITGGFVQPTRQAGRR